MAYIKVNYEKMLATADEIYHYLANLDQKMRYIDNKLESLVADWNGNDYQEVKKQWIEINLPGSTYYKMKNSLKDYADSLRESSDLYREAKLRTINRANTLCR